jgi:hypothetical protein
MRERSEKHGLDDVRSTPKRTFNGKGQVLTTLTQLLLGAGDPRGTFLKCPEFSSRSSKIGTAPQPGTLQKT